VSSRLLFLVNVVMNEVKIFETIIPLPPKTREKTTQKTTQKIMQAIVDDPQITRKMLADRIGLTEDGIKYHLNSMQRKGLLRRIGPDKGGYWEIVGKNNDG
jgi:predicted HTH transcriptional regulator